jgi:hypothetical protein
MYIDVDAPQTKAGDSQTFRDILNDISRDKRVVPVGYKAVPAGDPPGESVESLVKAELASLIEGMSAFKEQTEKRQGKIEIVLTSLAARMKEMDKEHARFHGEIGEIHDQIAKINAFISTVQVSPPQPSAPPMPPQQQYVPPPQQYIPQPSAPQAYWPYQPPR